MELGGVADAPDVLLADPTKIITISSYNHLGIKVKLSQCVIRSVMNMTTRYLNSSDVSH